MKKPISQGRIKKPYILEEILRNDNAGTDLEQVLQTQTLSERKPLRSLLYRVCLNLRATKGVPTSLRFFQCHTFCFWNRILTF